MFRISMDQESFPDKPRGDRVRATSTDLQMVSYVDALRLSGGLREAAHTFRQMRWPLVHVDGALEVTMDVASVEIALVALVSQVLAGARPEMTVEQALDALLEGKALARRQGGAA